MKQCLIMLENLKTTQLETYLTERKDIEKEIN